MKRQTIGKWFNNFLLLSVGLLTGYFFASQYNLPPTRSLNPVTPYLALEDAKIELTKSQAELQNQIKNLRQELSALKDQQKKYKRTNPHLIEQIKTLEEEIGLSEKVGDGLIITLADSPRETPTIESIVHAADLRDLVNVLWLNGAKDIEINSQRLVSTSSIDSIVNTILVNNTKITNPFDVEVIGNPQRLKTAVEKNSVLDDLWTRSRETGLVFHIENSKKITLSAFNGSYNIKFSKIADE